MSRGTTRDSIPARLSRRDFLRGGAVAVAGTIPALGCVGGSRPPNIVLIMADDLGYECLGCNGGSSYRTPHVDELARTGLRFTQTWATPLCTPSRVQLMSGQYPSRSGWTSGLWERPSSQQVVDPKLAILGRVLRGAGMATCVAGKWQLAMFADHPNHATQCGFDEHCLWTWNRHAKVGRVRHGRYWEPGVWQNGRFQPDLQRPGIFGPDVFCDYLIDFIRRHRDRPFFAYYPMVLPHPPMVVTPMNRSRPGRPGGTDTRLFPGMVAYMDTLVGRVVTALEDLGLRDDTLLLFTADNGTPAEITSRMGDRLVAGGKGTLSRSGAHVPFVANQPGRVPVGVCDDLVDLTDVLPTLAALAGAAIPVGHRVDGTSLVPQLRGRAGSPREWVLVELGYSRMLVDPRWTLFDDGRLCQRGPDCQPLSRGEGGAEAEAARARLEAVLAAFL